MNKVFIYLAIYILGWCVINKKFRPVSWRNAFQLHVQYLQSNHSGLSWKLECRQTGKLRALISGLAPSSSQVWYNVCIIVHGTTRLLSISSLCSHHMWTRPQRISSACSSNSPSNLERAHCPFLMKKCFLKFPASCFIFDWKVNILMKPREPHHLQKLKFPTQTHSLYTGYALRSPWILPVKHPPL